MTSPPPTPSTDDPLAAGLKSLLDPPLNATSSKLSQVYLAQAALSGELDRLISQLQHYLDTTDPPTLRRTVVKLASTTKRLAAVNASLENLQARINRVYHTLSKQRIPGGGGGGRS